MQSQMVLAAIAAMVTTTPALEKFEYSQLHMGVRVVLTMYAPNSQTAEKAATAAFAKFAELDAMMSDYRADSELMKLCAKAGQGPQPVSPELFLVIERAQEVSRLSEGAFDITCSPVVRLWREARKTKKMPSTDALQTALALVGFRNITLLDGAIWLQKPGMLLDLGGIAKGYACDKAIETLRANGIDRAMCEAGGDIVVSNAPPGKLGWKIAVKGVDFRFPISDFRGDESGSQIANRKSQIVPGEGYIWLKNGSVSTSGDAEQYVVIGGKRYSHIVDPRTGIGLTNRKQVSVIARDGLTSDPLTKALSILDEEKGTQLAKHYGAACVFVYPSNTARSEK